jgi:Restriction endonuclease AspBHI N-terminal/Restriction endonuclease
VITIPFSDLPTADLVVDAVYEGGKAGNTSDDPISKLMPGSGNLGGFRIAGRKSNRAFVVLYTSGEDKDCLNVRTGEFIYYGDNKTPGRDLHDPPGNQILRHVFAQLHNSPPTFSQIPPFFIFQKYATPASSRSVQFKGLAVPGFVALPATSDLVAVWKTSKGQRFQNYRATFTVLSTATVVRPWIGELTKSSPDDTLAPKEWQAWRTKGHYSPLVADSTTVIRSLEEQTPDTPAHQAILRAVWVHFRDRPHDFEMFAARIFQMHDQRVIVDEITRASVDGGRDAIGRYLLGLKEDPVYAEFALEAKCYRPGLYSENPNTVGVKEMSRLISRIRHREFGVLVTTSAIARQAYEEVRADRHPILIFSGKDIAHILTTNGLNTPELVQSMLDKDFPAALGA